MTLIAAIRPEGVPALFGDVLLSHTDPQHPPHVELATVDIADLESVMPRNSDRRLSGFQRKTAKINDRLVVAWAGVEFLAYSPIGDLRTAFADHHPSLQELKDFFAERRDQNLTIIGWLVVETAHVFRWTSFGLFIGDENDTFVEGSGNNSLRRFMAEQHLLRAGGATTTDRAIRNLVVLICQYFGAEVSEGLTVASYFGGGFEALVFDGQRFNYINNIVLTHWQILVEQDDPTLEPIRRVIWTRHVSDALFLRVMQIRHIGHGEYVMERDSRMTLRPIASKEDVGSVAFDAADVHCAFLYVPVAGLRLHGCIVEQGTEQLLRVRVDGKDTYLEWGDRFMQIVHRECVVLLGASADKLQSMGHPDFTTHEALSNARALLEAAKRMDPENSYVRKRLADVITDQAEAAAPQQRPGLLAEARALLLPLGEDPFALIGLAIIAAMEGSEADCRAFFNRIATLDEPTIEHLSTVKQLEGFRREEWFAQLVDRWRTGSKPP